MKRTIVISVIAAALSGVAAQAGEDVVGATPRGVAFFYTRHYVPHGKTERMVPEGYTRLFVGGVEYYYWEGMFYRMNGPEYVVVPAPVGAVVPVIPPGCRPVMVEGVPYYAVNNVTYMQTTVGYQVVPPPSVMVVRRPAEVVVAPAGPVASVGVGAPPLVVVAPVEESFTVNIPHARGGYTSVLIRRSGTGFVGPQGEYYTEFPRVEQLKVMYGK